MKKIIAVILCLVVSASMMLCGCEKAEEILDTVGTNVGTVLDPAEVTEIINDVVTTPLIRNEFTNEGNFMYDADNLNIKPKHLYWEGDTLIAECFVTNGKSTTAYNINVKRLAFGNDKVGIFADAAFGQINGLTVPAYGYTVWTFKFGSDCVSNPGADLSSINWENSVSYSH